MEVGQWDAERVVLAGVGAGTGAAGCGTAVEWIQHEVLDSCAVVIGKALRELIHFWECLGFWGGCVVGKWVVVV